MNKTTAFLSGDTPLCKGVTLIEASAGTGKTFTIASLILRLVLEEGVGIGEILAVTYTVAATEELRDRVRRRLRNALDALRNGEAADEITRKISTAEDREKAIRALEAAVQSFDEAQIFTIHGFCQRMLRENAFESGALFDMELLADPRPIMDEVARDFWRRRFYKASPLISRLALENGVSHGQWVELLSRLRNHPDIRILPEPAGDDCAGLTAMIERKYEEIVAEWKRSGAGVPKILMEHKLSRARDAFNLENVEEMAGALNGLVEGIESAPPDALGAIAKMSASEIAGRLLKGGIAPKGRFFDLCEEFTALTRDYSNRLTHEFLDFAKKEAVLRKARLNVVTYDDLLTRLRDALNGRDGEAFARLLGGRYRAALIDEFQDTDPVQYEIFHRVFGVGKHHLYFIGDPKQAIYGFRGADVFTYLRAAREASEKYTLGTNWRSEKGLLDALNLLFKDRPSLGKGIEYQAVSPPENPRPGFEPLTGNVGDARLRFRLLQGDEHDGGTLKNDHAEARIHAAVVADIVRLKSSGARLGERELRYGDMAVLVRTNAQAAELQELLRARRIKSILRSDKSVFHAAEAKEMQMLLEGLLEPGRGAYLNTALATSLFGASAVDLAASGEGEPARQQRLDQFLTYREVWKDACFIAMFRRLFVEQKVRERLVQLADGERKLTNFLHLAELLHHEEAARKLTPDALRLWLRKQIQSEEEAEESQLRLESDDDGVLIATIHKSKGLEYPVVFCPFLWKPADHANRTEILFHDPGADEALTLDLRKKKEVAEHDRLAGEERLGESLRMLYVALTRAQNLCHIYAGDKLKLEGSPLASVLGPPPLLPALKALEKESGGVIDVTPVDEAADARLETPAEAERSTEELHARHFGSAISQTRRIASFSALISDSAPEEIDRDAVETATVETAATEMEVETPELPDLERGVRAGLFWHDLLEHLDFQNTEAGSLVLDKLAEHGMDAARQGQILDRLRNLLAAELQPGLALERVPAADRRAEVEFSFPIAALNPERLTGIFARHASSGFPVDFSGGLGRLNFRPVEGFMRGFIDLFFKFQGRYYIVDWKSNRLGPRAADYAEAALRATMTGSFYFLQYHLYTVAADLFLRRHVPCFDYERDFGGVFYIFLRGVDARNPGVGVFRDCPPAALVRDLRETLTGRKS